MTFVDGGTWVTDSVHVPISHVQLSSVPVSDQDKARDFYLDALGSELVSDTEMGSAMTWVQVRLMGSVTSLTLVTWFSTMPAGSLKEPCWNPTLWRTTSQTCKARVSRSEPSKQRRVKA